MEKKKINLYMIDALVGNEYSKCLIESITEKEINKTIIVTKNRVFPDLTNYKVLYWLPSKSHDQNKTEKLISYCLYFIKTFFLFNFKKNILLHIQFFRNRFEVIFLLLLRISNIKYVFTAHNVLPHEEGKIDYYLKSIVYKHAEVIIVHSYTIKVKLLENFHIESDKIEVIPHGNFNDYLIKECLPKAEARKLFNLTEQDIVLLFFGFIREYKGLDDLLNAFEMAAEKNKNLKLLIAGAPNSDDLKQKYLTLVDGMKFKEQVITFFEYIENESIPNYFNSSDIVVLPYRDIDHSGIIHLAFSFSKPVIVTDVGDFSEVVKKDYGFLVESGNLQQLKDAIISSTQDLQNLKIMGEKAFNYNNDEYSWKKIGLKTYEVYKKLVFKQ